MFVNVGSSYSRNNFFRVGRCRWGDRNGAVLGTRRGGCLSRLSGATLVSFISSICNMSGVLSGGVRHLLLRSSGPGLVGGLAAALGKLEEQEGFMSC